MDVGSYKMNPKHIPSEEDFARARAAMRDRDRGLSEVRSRVLERFKSRGLHEAFVIFSPSKELFVAHLFYRLNSQIQEAGKSGLSDDIQRDILDELARVGRGNRETMNVQFEWDSDENVKTNFEGDYYLRLR